ncbi:MFS transporter [Corynebacterium striatum]
MSRKTQASVWSVPGYAATMVAVAAAFSAWSILLPVVPLAVLESGGSATLAGASTGAFMATTVMTQIATPRMLRSFGYRPVMAASALLLGVPAFGHLLGNEAWVVLLFSALRGIGFGALTVAENALIAEITPPRLLGKATGMIGVFIGFSQMLFLPAGIAMGQAWGFGTVYITAGIIGIVGFLMCLRVPRLKAARPSAAPQQYAVAPMWKLVAVPALALTTFSMSYGVVSTFIAPAARELDPVKGAAVGGLLLSVVGAAAMVLRYLAGVVADRLGRPGTLYIPAQVAAALGVGLIALTLGQGWSLWLLVLGAVIYGGSFGIAQNEALLSMFNRVPREKISEASAVWNIFYDVGTGLGSTVLGAIVAGSGYSGAFGVGAAIIAGGLLLTVTDMVLGKTRVSETHDIQTRLRRLRKV